MYRLVVRRVTIALLFFGAASAAAWAENLPVPSCWGKLSPMVSGIRLFTMDPQGNFTGWYLNNDPSHGINCEHGHFYLTGHSSGDHVEFTVQWQNPWQDCGSKTVWQDTVNGKNISAQWISYGPQGTQRGHDLFLQQH